MSKPSVILKPGMSIDRLADAVMSGRQVLAYQMRTGEEFEQVKAAIIADIAVALRLVRDECVARVRNEGHALKTCGHPDPGSELSGFARQALYHLADRVAAIGEPK